MPKNHNQTQNPDTNVSSSMRTSLAKLRKQYEDSVFLREKNANKLHVVDAQKDSEIKAPTHWTEVIGWCGGKEVVRFRKTPEC